MSGMPLRRAQAMLASIFGVALATQVALLAVAFATREIYIDNFKDGIKTLGKLYSSPLGIIIAALLADLPPKTKRTVQPVPLWVSVATCGAWNLLLLALSVGFALGSETIESFLQIFFEVGVDTSWLTAGALAYFFVKTASTPEKATP